MQLNNHQKESLRNFWTSTEVFLSVPRWKHPRTLPKHLYDQSTFSVLFMDKDEAFVGKDGELYTAFRIVLIKECTETLFTRTKLQLRQKCRGSHASVICS